MPRVATLLNVAAAKTGMAAKRASMNVIGLIRSGG